MAQHKCQTCGRGFETAVKLSAHIQRIHVANPDKPHACEVCGQTFRSKCTLVTHARIHSKEKPYECSECQARFTTSTGLKRHTLTHTNERPHACQYCGVAFARLSAKQVHERSHTGERNFICQTCNRAFTTSSQMNRHAATHNAEKPFECTICQKPISRKDHLRTHLIKQHNITDTAELKRLQNLGKKDLSLRAGVLSSTARSPSSSAATLSPGASTISASSPREPIVHTTREDFDNNNTYYHQPTSSFAVANSPESPVFDVDVDFALQVTDGDVSIENHGSSLTQDIFSGLDFSSTWFTQPQSRSSRNEIGRVSTTNEAPDFDELIASADLQGIALPDVIHMPQFSNSPDSYNSFSPDTSTEKTGISSNHTSNGHMRDLDVIDSNFMDISDECLRKMQLLNLDPAVCAKVFQAHKSGAGECSGMPYGDSLTDVF